MAPLSPALVGVIYFYFGTARKASCCFDYCSFVVYNLSQEYDSTSMLLSQDCFWATWFVCVCMWQKFPQNFKAFGFSSVKNAIFHKGCTLNSDCLGAASPFSNALVEAVLVSSLFLGAAGSGTPSLQAQALIKGALGCMGSAVMPYGFSVLGDWWDLLRPGVELCTSCPHIRSCTSQPQTTRGGPVWPF